MKLPEKDEVLQSLQGYATGIRERWEALGWKQRGGVMAVIVLACLFLFFLLPAPESREQMPGNVKVYLHVKPGMTTREIGTQLEQHGVIESRTKFWLVAKLNGYEDKIRAGNYALHPGMEPREVLSLLVEGKTARVKFTIPEGFRVRDIAKRLAQEGLVDEQEFLKKAKEKYFKPDIYI